MFHEIEMCLPPRLQRLFGGHHEALRRSRVVVTGFKKKKEIVGFFSRLSEISNLNHRLLEQHVL